MPSGYVTLGQIADRFPGLITVACNRCSRRGRLGAARLVTRYGRDFPAPELLRVLAADCPRMIANEMHDPCGVCFPGLAGRG